MSQAPHQSPLFPSSAGYDVLPLHGYGKLHYFASWLGASAASDCFARLLAEVQWQQPQITVYGQRRVIPRQQAWYGDAGAAMIYSGSTFEPQPWSALLWHLKQKLEQQCAVQFNSVLINHYRDGSDSVSWHADDERELGSDPVIASISLGAERTFSFRPKSSRGPNAQCKRIDLPLRHGDLVVMDGAIQRYWQHAILKTTKVHDARINLTFRYITHQN